MGKYLTKLMLKTFLWAAVCFCLLLTERETAQAKDFSGQLHALGAVLMDGDSGRVLYGKNQDKRMAMASTTKVMTCIVALENAGEDEVVTVSAKAQAQPDVQMNMVEGEQYRLGDLLYSLMLQSHNDTAVAIAEHVGGSVEGFAAMMNEKAAQLGCKNTHFVTPNGLDAADEGGSHSTTPRELALMMRYAINNKKFLEITGTADYSFSELSGKRSVSLHNTNALLGSMEGILSGKTGFTGEAGYCYVCAVKRDERTFIVALLACGWPGNKTYKWEDTGKLVSYGFDSYHYHELSEIPQIGAVSIKDGIPISDRLFEPAYSNLKILGLDAQKKRFLLNDSEKIKIKKEIKKNIIAPVKKHEAVGKVTFLLDGQELCSYPVVVASKIREKDIRWYFQKLTEKFLFS